MKHQTPRTPPRTLWDMGYRWTRASLEMARTADASERQVMTWQDLDHAPHFPVLSDRLVQLHADGWDILSVQVETYDISASDGPDVAMFNCAVH
jgi:uncharacterized protein Usg